MEVVDIRASLGNLLDHAGVDAVKNHLQEQAKSREAAHINSWKTAMYRELAINEWFCSGGFRE